MDKTANSSANLAKLKKQLDSLKKMRMQAQANDFHTVKHSLENDVFDSEDFFNEN